MYGIAGSTMIIFGVIMYSLRKRIRAFAALGKLRYFLQVHIALCLIGPVLVLYHSTFKLGGIVGIGFWSMVAVVLSGIIGRYIYVQIPKGIQGQALSLRELEAENRRLFEHLKEHHEFSADEVRNLDQLVDATLPAKGSPLRTLWVILRHDLHLVLSGTILRQWLLAKGVDRARVASCTTIVRRRSVLHRRILFLEQLQRLFGYWHVIHVPFTLILLVIFLVHISTAFFFGYVWGG